MIVSQCITVAVCAQPTSTSFNVIQAIEQHLPLAQQIARIAYHKYGRNFEHDDLVGYGHLGLITAAKKYAALRYDIQQAVDFTVYVEKRIWRSIEVGRDHMAAIGRWHYRMIKRGQMAKPQFVRDGEDFSLANAVAVEWEEPKVQTETEEMLQWLRQQNPLWARVVELHINQGLSHQQVGRVIGRSPTAASSMCSRAINLLRWKYNEDAYHHDDRTARRRKSSLQSA